METLTQVNELKEDLFEEIDRKLGVKNENYASKDDVFANFNMGAVLNRTSRVKYANGLMTKHIVRLLMQADTMTMPDLKEISTDMMTYLVLIYGMRMMEPGPTKATVFSPDLGQGGRVINEEDHEVGETWDNLKY
jgi:hypothetical protein